MNQLVEKSYDMNITIRDLHADPFRSFQPSEISELEYISVLFIEQDLVFYLILFDRSEIIKVKLVTEQTEK